MNLHLRKASPYEVDELHEILRKCGQDMKVRLRLGHWDPPYPLDLMRKSAHPFHTKLYGETGMVCFEKMKRDFFQV